MSTNNWWLWKELKNAGVDVEAENNPLIRAHVGAVEHKIYTPTQDEYIISVELVQKVIELGGTIISYPTSWCQSSYEAKEYGKEHGVQVLPHGAVFSIFGIRT